MRKKASLIFLFCISIIFGSSIYTLHTNAAGDEDWIQAYIEYIESHRYVSYSDMEEVLPENGTYDLIDADGKETPNILVSTGTEPNNELFVLAYDSDAEMVINRSVETTDLPEGIDDPQHLRFTQEELVRALRSNKSITANTNWGAAYQRFLIYSSYLSGEEEYTAADDVTGVIYDIDKDGIPELILFDGYMGADYCPTYVYSFTDTQGSARDAEVNCIGSIPDSLYASYAEGYEGPLYACSWGDSSLYKISKDGDSVSKEAVLEMDVSQSVLFENYESVTTGGVDWLISELSAYEDAALYFEDAPTAVRELDDFLGWLSWWGMNYDPASADISDEDAMFWHLSMLGRNMKKYPGSIVKYDSWTAGAAATEDPKKTMYGSYLQLDGKDLERVLKEIYNLSDAQIKELRSFDGDYMYYQNGDYYAALGGVGGGYGAYVTGIERVGDCFQVTYKRVYYPDGPMGNEYETRYALFTVKELDGRNYWSIYREGADDLSDEAEGIKSDFFEKYDRQEQTTEEVTTEETVTTEEELTTTEEETDTEEETTEEPARGRGPAKKEKGEESSGFPIAAIIGIAAAWVLAIGGAVFAILHGKKKKAQQTAQPAGHQTQMPVQPVQPEVPAQPQQSIQPVQQPQQTQQPAYCPDCGAQITEGQNFCPVCGKQLR